QARQGNFNMAEQHVRGVDVEASYRLPLSRLGEELPGSLQFRVIGTRNLKNFTDDGNPNTLDFSAIGSGLPRNRVNAGVDFTLNKFTGGVTMRYFSATVSSNAAIECTSGCPLSTTVQTTFDDIHTKPTARYFDLSLAYRLDSLFGHESDSRVFFNVRNIADK